MSNIDNTYSISNDLDELEEEARNATRENFTAARDYVLGLLHRNGYQAALLGGYSLALRGSPRATYDIDVAVLGGVTMRHVQNIIQNDPRLRRPSGPSADVLRIFVRTGHPHDRSSDREQLVEVDLLIGGGLGGSSRASIEMFRVGSREIPMYDIATMIRNKLRAFNDRQGGNDMEDLVWLAQHHQAQFHAIRNDLDYDQREFFFEAFILENGHGEAADQLKQVMGVTWPPEA